MIAATLNEVFNEVLISTYWNVNSYAFFSL